MWSRWKSAVYTHTHCAAMDTSDPQWTSWWNCINTLAAISVTVSLKTNYVKDYIFKLTVSFGNCLHVATKDTITACLAYRKECGPRIMMNHCDDSVTVKELVPVSGKFKKNPLKFHLLSFVHCPSEPLWQGEGSGNRSWPSGCLALPLWRPPWPTALFFFPPTKWVKSTHW